MSNAFLLSSVIYLSISILTCVSTPEPPKVSTRRVVTYYIYIYNPGSGREYPHSCVILLNAHHLPNRGQEGGALNNKTRSSYNLYKYIQIVRMQHQLQ